MQALRGALGFWLTSVLVVACITAFDTLVLHDLEPDFGGPFGNFATTLALYAMLALPAAFCHGGATFLLRRALTRVSSVGLLVASGLSAIAFLALLYVIGPLPLNLPVKPLLLPSVIGFVVSLLMLSAASKVSARLHVGAA